MGTIVQINPCARLLRALCYGAAVLALLGAAGVRPASAADEVPELTTDRPDFTEASIVVPRGTLQLESGFTWTDEPGGVRAWDAGELLLRWGITNRTEARLGVPIYSWIRGGGMRISGFGDTYVGIKHQLGPVNGWDLALIPAIWVPTGANALTSDHVDPELKFVWSRDLSDKWSISGMFAGYWTGAAGAPNFTWQPTVSLGRSLGARWGTFLEYAGAFAEGEEGMHLIHHGYTYLLSRLQQVDLHLGFGLSDTAPDFFVGAGYSVRFR